MSDTFHALLSRRCCDVPENLGKGNVQRARWRLFVVLPNSAQFPQFEWPVSRRNVIPTPDERVRALASLGYRLAPDAEWTWTEDETPGYHGHPSAVSLLGGTSVVPASGGE
ncbi:DUF6303 family protein [Streptomyces nymphaeiformis]|jgi:hypothetical protein|uniref:Uncharacterized protein n=1 Tax=Streptomyces nymphaeiformis TaxID=2663842 RepID=A0A7W7XHE1_9ACTN|nr:DUF6303 family protein [Streptomyces nymphaeiformis]MBB4987466.1 hypothetical protein [Streptomyces nymphaeiformis]